MGNCFAKKYTIIISQISKNNNPKEIATLWDIIGDEFNNYYDGYIKDSETEKSFFFMNVPANMIKIARTRVLKYSFMKIEFFEKSKYKKIN